LNQDRIQAYVNAIYDAAMDSTRWTSLLEWFSDDFAGGAPVVLAIASRVGDPLTIPTYHLVRSSPEYMDLYFERYVSPDANPLVSLGPHLPVNACFTDTSIVSERELVRTGCYNDIVRPQGAHHSVYAMIPFDGDHNAVFQIGRRFGMEPIGVQEIAVVDALLPHMRRALQIGRRFSSLESELDAALMALDQFRIGVVLISGTCEVIFANCVAEAIFARNDGLGVLHRHLMAATPALTAALARLIGGAVETGGGHGLSAGGVLALPRPSMLRPFEVLVAPIPAGARMFDALHPGATVFIADPEQTYEVPTGVVARLYDLTPAEARVACAIAMFNSLPVAAEHLGIAVTTARTHLQRVFDKTGARSQVELVHLILRSPAGLYCQAPVRDHPDR
jgi:DNA-binding CsgD family transcriptional regulator